MKKMIMTVMVVMVATFSAIAQESFPPIEIVEGTFLGETIPLRDFPTIQEQEYTLEQLTVIEQQFQVSGSESTGVNHSFTDPLIQTNPMQRATATQLVNFDGINSSESGAIPPDPTGAVGPNHYVNAVNVAIKIFDKSGTLLAGPTNLGSFLGAFGNGDPIVMYDQRADRWFVSQFRVSTDALIIGVSTSPDPTGTFNVYSYPLDAFPDYPHYGTWPGAYIVGANKAGQSVYGFERDVMLAGGPSPRLVGFNPPSLIRNPNTVFGPQPANLIGYEYPDDLVDGYLVYLQDDDWGAPAITEDHLKIWTLTLDWENDDFSISAPVEVPTAPFNSIFFPFGAGDIEQPGTSQRIDGLGGIISYMANYRTFDTHNSFLLNFNVDIDGNNTSGIRWIELRNTGGSGAFSVFQEGTFTQPDGDSAFMGSTNMDEEGNIGLAYNVGSSSTRVGIRYTYRMAGDPLGQMTGTETSFVESGGIQTGINRFGDYTQMTIDFDNRGFWYTAEYLPSNNSWSSRVSAFKLIDDKTDDVGVYNIVTPSFGGPYGASETVEVAVANFGTDAQSNFDIELYVDGSLVATETFTGTLNGGEVDTYTFSQSIDISNASQVYNVEARTILGGDEFAGNDGFDRDYTFTILSTTDEIFQNTDLLIYPIEGKLYEIIFKTDAFEGVNFAVRNILGQEITSGAMEAFNGGQRAQVDFSGQASGVYLIEISQGKRSVTKKLLVR